jgi:hypothetical protein
MKIITICFGVLLALLGVSNYIATDMESIFALVPALFGVFITLFGILQGKWAHNNPLFGSLLLALLTLIGALRGLWNLVILLTGGQPVLPTQVIGVRSILGVSAVVFIILGLTLIQDFWHGWKAFGQFLGDWLARVVLTIFYFTIFVPFGLGVRLFGDPLKINTLPAELWRPRSTGDQKLEEIQRQF